MQLAAFVIVDSALQCSNTFKPPSIVIKPKTSSFPMVPTALQSKMLFVKLETKEKPAELLLSAWQSATKLLSAPTKLKPVAQPTASTLSTRHLSPCTKIPTSVASHTVPFLMVTFCMPG